MSKSARSDPSASIQHPLPVELIERSIFLIRGQKVMLDIDLAQLPHSKEQFSPFFEQSMFISPLFSVKVCLGLATSDYTDHSDPKNL